MKFIILFLICASIAIEQINVKAKIGHKNFPFLVLLYLDAEEEPELFCSGSLISPSYVLSTCHCLGEYKKNQGIIMKHNLHRLRLSCGDQHRKAESMTFCCEGAHPYESIRDFASVKVKEPFKLDNIIVLPIPKTRFELNSILETGMQFEIECYTAVCYGPIVEKLNLHLTSLTQCEELLEATALNGLKIKNIKSFCAISKNKSGGCIKGPAIGSPLICNGSAIGMLSWYLEFGCGAQDDKYHLLTLNHKLDGLHSALIRLQKTGKFDLSNYAVKIMNQGLLILPMTTLVFHNQICNIMALL